MERLIPSTGDGFFGKLAAKSGFFGEQIRWELGRARRRFSRRFGAPGWSILFCSLVATLAWLVAHERSARLHELSEQLDKQQKVLTQRALNRTQELDPARSHDGRSRLKAFAEHLLPHREIPRIVEEILVLAESHGLLIERGEYRMQAVSAGKFLRYQMSLPVKGEVRTVKQFIQAALLAQKNMALESVQFKRQRVDSPELEARIQWVLFARLPGNELERFGVSDVMAGK